MIEHYEIKNIKIDYASLYGVLPGERTFAGALQRAKHKLLTDPEGYRREHAEDIRRYTESFIRFRQNNRKLKNYTNA